MILKLNSQSFIVNYWKSFTNLLERQKITAFLWSIIFWKRWFTYLKSLKKSFQKNENLRFKHIVIRKSCWTVQIDCLKFETAKYVCELKQILYYLYYNSPTHVIIFLSGLDLHLLMNWRCFFQLQICTILSQYDLCTRDNGLPKFGLFYNGPYFTKISFLGFFTCATYIYFILFF